MEYRVHQCNFETDVAFRQSFEQQRVSFSKSGGSQPLVKAFAAVCTRTCAKEHESRAHKGDFTTEAQRKLNRAETLPRTSFAMMLVSLWLRVSVVKSP